MNNFLEIVDGEDKSSALKNRIRNQYKHLRKWAKRTHNNCFRLYNQEIAHYPLAIDFYAGRFCIHYFSPKRTLEEPSKELIDETNCILSELFGINSQVIYWKKRTKHKETRQYEKMENSQEFFPVEEYGALFWVNLRDYLDTGIFLDHRETRQYVASRALEKRVLNLFAYTCSFSVHAALAGAKFTKSVDLSNTYLNWGKNNFKLNNLNQKNNQIVRADCLKFFDHEIQHREKYDIIIIDPPTISRSKKMTQLFDIQKDYVFLLEKAIELLAENGFIIFSTNSKKFKFDETLLPTCKIEELTNKTIPIDFKDSKIHRTWKIDLRSN